MDITVTADLLIQVAYALAIGLFIGLEREHHILSEDIPPHETPAQRGVAKDEWGVALGVRTFALLSLLGWAIGFGGLAWPWLPPLGLVVIGILVAVQYVVTRRAEGTGLTTEVAAVLTFVLGMIVNHDRALAVALALATTLLLIAKPWVHALVGKLRRVELSGTLQLLILLAIVLPLLPTEARDPWGALPPRKIGLFVVLIAGISYVGYILSRIIGGRRGMGLTGIIGGLASSTALTVAMTKMGRKSPDIRKPAQMAIFLANTVMFIRVIVITAVLSRTVATRLAIPMGVMAAVMLAGGAWKWRAAHKESKQGVEVDTGETFKNPFALLPALQWGAVLCAVLLLATLAQKWLGDRGLLAAAAVSGLADVDAITLAVTRQAAQNEITVSVGTLAVTIAVLSNTLVKAGMALFGGGRAFGLSIVVVALATVTAGIVSALLASW
jgi:uncharacterized membrane protein (DUF4010 family)